jgi:YgiT-type zinc finger domain-containing protein
MKCVICKSGDVAAATVQAEIKVGRDRLLVPVEAEACQECGEQYYAPEVLRHLERVRGDFTRKAISPPSIGRVFQVS